ncbi:MAG: outer membrane protein assembly factor [Alphaproteobacteria bacterium]|nr:MAG: outer membrane protein assembly factor [Alphaproteobacteria bacterium]
MLAALVLLGLAVCLAAPAAHAKSGPASYSLKLDFVLLSDSETLTPLLKSASRLYEHKDDSITSLSRLEGRLQADLDGFRRVLRSEGYYAAALDNRVSRREGHIAVEIIVNPGPRFRIGATKVELTGEGGPDLAAEATQTLPVGTPARAEMIVATERALVSSLTNAGFPFADIGERDVVVDHRDKSVTVTYRFDTGPKALFGDVSFEGLEVAEADYLERFKPFEKGETYSQQQADEFRLRLSSSGLFRIVTVSPRREMLDEGDGDAEPVPLLVKVQEAPRRLIELGAGYSTGEGFEAEAAWTNRNMWGRGENVKFAATLGEIEQTVKGTLRKPHFRRYDQTLTAASRFGRESTPAYTSHLFENSVGVERRLAKTLVGGAGVEAKLTQIREDGERDSFLLVGTPLALTWDITDNLLDPKKGARVNLRLKPTVSTIGDQFTFLTSELNASVYQQLFGIERVTMAARGRLGSIWGASVDQLPLSEHFFAGGGGSVRGFEYQGLGPRDDDGDPLGGLSVAEVAFEARIRISETIGIVPFVDGGNVYQGHTPKLSGFRWGGGLGLRYYTSFAPVRLDVAVPFDKQEGDASFTLYISLGQAF